MMPPTTARIFIAYTTGILAEPHPYSLLNVNTFWQTAREGLFDALSMSLTQLFSILLLFATTLTALLLARYAWLRRPALGVTRFTVLMLAVALWSTGYALELMLPGLAAKVALTKVQYLGIVAFPVAWLTFVIAHTGRKQWLNGRNLILLALIPATTLLLVLTNEAHGLVWQSFGLTSSGSLMLLAPVYGPWFWVHTAFSYLVIALAYVLLLANWRREIVSLYRWQAVPLLFSIMVLPWLGNLFYISGFSPVDLTPFTFLIAAVALGFTILRFRLFDITPLAQTTILNSIDEPLLALDETGHLIYYNRAARPLLGRPRSELLGQSITAVWPELATFDAGTPQTIVTPPLPQNGHARRFALHIAPLYDDHVRAGGRLLTLHDVTERQQLDELRSDLTHTMVHDLRAPITNTLFALEMLRAQEDEDPQSREKLLDITYNSTKKTLQLINEILDVNRLEAGELPLTLQPVNLPALVAAAVDSFMPQIQRRKLTIVNAVPADLPAVLADEQLLQRVLQNLLDNSIKFSPDGGQVRIDARLETKSLPLARQATPAVIVSISDSGPGIPGTLQDRIFDKYVTAGNGQSSGSGLGLTFCRMVLDAHDEAIWLENRPGGGATLAFSLSTAPLPNVS